MSSTEEWRGASFISYALVSRTLQGCDLWILPGGHRVDVGTAEQFLCKCITDSTVS